MFISISFYWISRFWLLIIPLIDSSWRDDSNGCHIIILHEISAGVKFLALGAVCSSYNLVFDGDYWQFLVHNIIGKGIWRLILWYTCRGRWEHSIEVEIIMIGWYYSYCSRENNGHCCLLFLFVWREGKRYNSRPLNTVKTPLWEEDSTAHFIPARACLPSPRSQLCLFSLYYGTDLSLSLSRMWRGSWGNSIGITHIIISKKNNRGQWLQWIAKAYLLLFTFTMALSLFSLSAM